MKLLDIHMLFTGTCCQSKSSTKLSCYHNTVSGCNGRLVVMVGFRPQLSWLGKLLGTMPERCIVDGCTPPLVLTLLTVHKIAICLQVSRDRPAYTEWHGCWPLPGN